jgi:hypothetical protein
MTKSQRRAVSRHRKRQKQRGIVRVEVRVAKADATVIKSIARALLDPVRALQVRTFVTDKLDKRPNFFELLQMCPDGIDWDNLRDKNDFGREVDLGFDD